LKVVGGIAVLMGMFKAGIEILNFFS
jgi:hypothetical protein